jgi:hypothetical protein
VRNADDGSYSYGGYAYPDAFSGALTDVKISGGSVALKFSGVDGWIFWRPVLRPCNGVNPLATCPCGYPSDGVCVTLP